MLTNQNQSEEFRYWKYPWQKWACLFIGVSNVILLFIRFQEYNRIALLKDEIFSPTEWENYSVDQSLQCVNAGVLAVSFFGLFFIGVFLRSRKNIQIAKGLLLMSIALIWGEAGFTHQFTLLTEGLKIIWSILLLLVLGCSLYSFGKPKHLSRSFKQYLHQRLLVVCNETKV